MALLKQTWAVSAIVELGTCLKMAHLFTIPPHPIPTIPRSIWEYADLFRRDAANIGSAEKLPSTRVDIAGAVHVQTRSGWSATSQWTSRCRTRLIFPDQHY